MGLIDQGLHQNNMDLFLLMGQSNMSGRGEVEEVDRYVHPRIFVLKNNLEWQFAQAPLHEDKRAGVGLGLEFARVLANRRPSKNIGLIPCAVGGSPLSRWMPGCDLYESALIKAKKAMEVGTVRGLLWHQGENDSCGIEKTQTYKERFFKMLCSIRSDLDSPSLPIIIGELGSFLIEFLSKDETIQKNPSIIKKAMINLVKNDHNIHFVTSEGLVDIGDSLHFDARSVREFGIRYANIYLKDYKE